MSSLGANDPDLHRLSDKVRDAIFCEEILPKIFNNVKSQPSPIAVIFGGQPGSGKSAMVEMIAKQYKGKGDCALIIGDELRDYHPGYESLLQEDDKTAAFYTDRDTAYWVERAIDYAKGIKCNLIIEGTMRVKEKVEQTMLGLRQAGYKVEAHVLAVSPLLSWQGVLQRYENQRADRGFGRMTTPEAHKNGHEGMPKTLAHIETQQLADKIVVYKRGAEIIYENTFQDNKWGQATNAAAIVEAERNRHWSGQEIAAYLKASDALIALMQREEKRASALDVDMVIGLKKEACFMSGGLQSVASIGSELMAYIDKQCQLHELIVAKNSSLATDPPLAKAHGEAALKIDQALEKIASSALERPTIKQALGLKGRGPSATIAEIGGFQRLKEKLCQGQLTSRDVAALLRHMQDKAQEIDRSRSQGRDLSR